jgi:surface antigen
VPGCNMGALYLYQLRRLGEGSKRMGPIALGPANEWAGAGTYQKRAKTRGHTYDVTSTPK